MIRSFFEEKKNIVAVFVGTILFIIYFFPYLGNTMVGIDTYSFVNYPATSENWLDIGRQGAVLLHRIFFQSIFSMFYAESMALIFFLLAFACYVLLFYRVGNVSAGKTCLFFLMCMIHPIWIEQLYYTLQIFDIAVGMFLVPFILLMTFQEKWIWWVGSVPLLILLFSIYQTFVIIYIAGCIVCVLLIYFQKAEANEKEEKNIFLKLSVRQGSIFLIAFIINTIITRLFFSHGTYLDGQVRWGVDSVQDCIQRIISSGWSMLSGEGVFYSLSLSISLILSAIAIITFIMKYKHQKEKWVACIAYFVLQLCPFLLNIYLGNTSVYRSLFHLPFVIACNILLFFVLLNKITIHKLLQRIVTIGLIFILLTQYYTSSLLQYTTMIVRQEDERRAYEIEAKITGTTMGSSKQVAFIGYWPTRKNSIYTYAETTNVSVFEFAQWGEPRYYETTAWIVEYMKSQGINIRGANAEQVEKARQAAQDMTTFPLDGSVKELDDVIVVKLAPDDYFASEVMEAGISEKKMEAMPETSDQLNGNVDVISLQDNILTISGWILEWQCNSSYVLPAVHLWDEEAGTLYSLSSGTQSRADLSAAFPDGTDYSHSGVLAKGAMDQLPKDSLNHCRILLSTTRNGEIKYFDTGKYVTDYLTDIAK